MYEFVQLHSFFTLKIYKLKVYQVYNIQCPPLQPLFNLTGFICLTISNMSSHSDWIYLVLDSGAIIKGHGFNLGCQNILTVHNVIEEIRDSKSRDLLTRLPVVIIEKEPSIEALKAVAQTAQKTGDFAQLSKTDLKLIALTYMLDKELNGDFSKNVRLSYNYNQLSITPISRILLKLAYDLRCIQRS